jgi:hypothetical protein
VRAVRACVLPSPVCVPLVLVSFSAYLCPVPTFSESEYQQTDVMFFVFVIMSAVSDAGRIHTPDGMRVRGAAEVSHVFDAPCDDVHAELVHL